LRKPIDTTLSEPMFADAGSGGAAGGKPELVQEFPIGADAVSAARRSLDRFGGRLEGPLLDDVRLLVSELVTNSVRHSGAAGQETSVGLNVALKPDCIRVEVRDPGDGFEPEAAPAEDMSSGWGLYLVDRLADRWGVHNDDVITLVWFEITL
jgi:anti-sigma regulatory factor (Ser/Thr protein kinase)